MKHINSPILAGLIFLCIGSVGYAESLEPQVLKCGAFRIRNIFESARVELFGDCNRDILIDPRGNVIGFDLATCKNRIANGEHEVRDKCLQQLKSQAKKDADTNAYTCRRNCRTDQTGCDFQILADPTNIMTPDSNTSSCEVYSSDGRQIQFRCSAECSGSVQTVTMCTPCQDKCATYGVGKGND